MRMIILGAAFAMISATAFAGESATPAGDAKAGLAAFNKYGCYSCHGIIGQGTLRDGPHLNVAATGFPALVAQLRHPRYEMPAYTEVQITDQQIADIYTYLTTLPKSPDPKSINLLQ